MATRLRLQLPADAAARLASMTPEELLAFSEFTGIPVLSIAQVGAREEPKPNVWDVDALRVKLSAQYKGTVTSYLDKEMLDNPPEL